MAVAFRLSGILELSTASFEARMAAAEKSLQRFGSAHGQAHDAVRNLKSGLQTLAFEGLGALPGPLARITTGLGALTLGSPIVLGILGALGAINLATDALAKSTAAASKENEEFLRSLEAIGPHARMIGLQMRAREIEDQITARQQAFQTQDRFGRRTVAPFDPELIRLQQELAKLNIEISNAADAAAKAAKSINDARLKLITATGPTEFTEGVPGLTSRHAPLLGLIRKSDPLGDLLDQAQHFLEGAGFQEALADLNRETDEQVRNIKELLKGYEDARRASQQFRIALASAITGAVFGLANAHGPAGFAGGALSGAGGILSALATKNPALGLPGLILTGLGGVFSLFDHSEDRRAAEAEANNERRHRELLQAMADSEPIIVPVRAGAFTDPREMDELAAAIQDARARRVLPGGVG